MNISILSANILNHNTAKSWTDSIPRSKKSLRRIPLRKIINNNNYIMSNTKPISNNTETRNLTKLAEPTGNIYESVKIISIRSNQIAAAVKKELSEKLAQFKSDADALEETFENKEQAEISKYYEVQPKPTLVAIHEFEENQIYYRKAEE
jgi:DNA-directed RNA polymerase subunit K/omega